MKKGLKLIIGLLILIFLTIVVITFDPEIIKFIEGLRNGFLDYAFLSVAYASDIIIIFFFLTTLFLWKENKRRWILPLWLSGVLAIITSFLLKIIVKRPRPFQEGIVSVLGILFHFMKDNFTTWNFSFPSFQSMLVFSALPILSKEFKKFRYIWLIFAGLVAFSRVYFGVHYLSDVMVGAVIGILIGYSIVLIEEKSEIGLKLMRKLKMSK